MGPCLNADGLVSSRIYVAGRSGCLGVRRARRATEEDRSHSQNFLGPYWVLAIYAAINVPVARALSTPLTWPMIRSARGPLADSILLYVTPTNCLVIALILPLTTELKRSRDSLSGLRTELKLSRDSLQGSRGPVACAILVSVTPGNHAVYAYSVLV